MIVLIEIICIFAPRTPRMLSLISPQWKYVGAQALLYLALVIEPFTIGVSATYCGPALGPLLSGFAVEAKGWRWFLRESLWIAGPIFLILPIIVSTKITSSLSVTSGTFSSSSRRKAWYAKCGFLRLLSWIREMFLKAEWVDFGVAGR